MTKKEFSNHLSNHWYLYLIAFLLLMFLSSWGIRLTAAPTKKEKVSIFIVAYDCNQDELYDKLNDNRDEYLKKVEILQYSNDDDYLYVYLGAYYTDCDILIVPESIIESNGIASSIILNDKEIDGVIDSETKFYEVGDDYYGIMIHEKGTTNEILSDYITYTSTDSETKEIIDENYYLLISKESYHMGYLNNSDFDGGIQVLKELFNDEN